MIFPKIEYNLVESSVEGGIASLNPYTGDLQLTPFEKDKPMSLQYSVDYDNRIQFFEDFQGNTATKVPCSERRVFEMTYTGIYLNKELFIVGKGAKYLNVHRTSLYLNIFQSIMDLLEVYPMGQVIDYLFQKSRVRKILWLWKDNPKYQIYKSSGVLLPYDSHLLLNRQPGNYTEEDLHRMVHICRSDLQCDFMVIMIDKHGIKELFS